MRYEENEHKLDSEVNIQEVDVLLLCKKNDI
jgi:hypothetical protein